ncbi:MAG: DUF3347 domain-containing protein [Bacteroidia bacterium]
MSKKTILAVAIIVTAIMQTTSAQTQEMSKDTSVSANPLHKVISAYLVLKNALAKDDGEAASKSSKALYKAIDKVPMDKLTAAQHTVWIKYMDKLSYDSEHIKETAETEHQREHFTSLSKNIYAVVKEFNTNSAELYYQFCPMANDGKGAYWLSESEKISNPYMGKKMPSCGSIKETIKANN